MIWLLTGPMAIQRVGPTRHARSARRWRSGRRRPRNTPTGRRSAASSASAAISADAAPVARPPFLQHRGVVEREPRRLLDAVDIEARRRRARRRKRGRTYPRSWKLLSMAGPGNGPPAPVKSSGCPGAIDNRQPIREAGGRQLVARVLQIDVVRNNQQSYEVIPAKAGIQGPRRVGLPPAIPAFAGMTTPSISMTRSTRVFSRHSCRHLARRRRGGYA